MSENDADLTDRELDAVEDRLSLVSARREPVPTAVLENALAALELRDLDSELAALVADSFDISDDRLALVRGPLDVRLLTFEAPGLVVELQVSSTGGRRSLEGQVSGAGGDLSLEHPDGVLPISTDEHGRFRVDTVPAGRLRLAMQVESRAVTTTWVDV